MLFTKPVTVPIFSAVERVGKVTISSSVTIKGMTAVLRSCRCCASGWGDTPDGMLNIFWGLFWMLSWIFTFQDPGMVVIHSLRLESSCTNQKPGNFFLLQIINILKITPQLQMSYICDVIFFELLSTHIIKNPWKAILMRFTLLVTDAPL